MVKQVVQDTFEGLKSQAKHTLDAVGQLPKDITKSMLGEKGTGEDKGGLPAGGKTADPAKQQQGKVGSAAQARLAQMRSKDEQEREVKIAKIRQQIKYLEKQEADRKRFEQEKNADKDKQEREEQEEREKVVQLKKEAAKQRVLQGQTSARPKGPVGPLGLVLKKKKGTKELGVAKKF